MYSACSTELFLVKVIPAVIRYSIAFYYCSCVLLNCDCVLFPFPLPFSHHYQVMSSLNVVMSLLECGYELINEFAVPFAVKRYRYEELSFSFVSVLY